ncbi:hypothetical protein [Methylocapsa palsarum]|nr:hypothetical protein [Methylocapsa palsarum]
MSRHFLPSVLACIAFALPAAAKAEKHFKEYQGDQPSRRKSSLPAFDAVDFIVDGVEHLGQAVAVTGCYLIQANDWMFFCAAYSTDKRHLGNITLDSKSMNRESLRRALNNCNGIDADDACFVDVYGDAYDPLAPRSDHPETPQPEAWLKNVVIKWKD